MINVWRAVKVYPTVRPGGCWVRDCGVPKDRSYPLVAVVWPGTWTPQSA